MHLTYINSFNAYHMPAIKVLLIPLLFIQQTEEESTKFSMYSYSKYSTSSTDSMNSETLSTIHSFPSGSRLECMGLHTLN